MTPLRIVLNIEETPILEGFKTSAGYHRAFGKATTIGALPKGTDGGKATAYVAGHLPDGRPVILETTLALLTAGVNALNARHGG